MRGFSEALDDGSVLTCGDDRYGQRGGDSSGAVWTKLHLRGVRKIDAGWQFRMVADSIRSEHFAAATGLNWYVALTPKTTGSRTRGVGVSMGSWDWGIHQTSSSRRLWPFKVEWLTSYAVLDSH